MTLDSATITPRFIEELVNSATNKIVEKLKEIDISIDYVASALLDQSAMGIKFDQAAMGRVGAKKLRTYPSRSTVTDDPQR